MSPLPQIVTPALLAAIRKYPKLPQHTWYLITATTLSVLNRPDEIPFVYRYALDHDAGAFDSTHVHEEKLRISRRMREALIKAAAIGGLPKVSICRARDPSPNPGLTFLLDHKRAPRPQNSDPAKSPR